MHSNRNYVLEINKIVMKRFIGWGVSAAKLVFCVCILVFSKFDIPNPSRPLLPTTFRLTNKMFRRSHALDEIMCTVKGEESHVLKILLTVLWCYSIGLSPDDGIEVIGLCLVCGRIGGYHLHQVDRCAWGNDILYFS